MAAGEGEGRRSVVISAAEWLTLATAAERRGDLLTAVDVAERGLVQHPDDLWLRHRLVLALARAGATGEAVRRFEGFGLAESTEEDVASLGARLAKDGALAASGGARSGAAVVARDRYRTVYAVTGGYYPAINAATMSLLAGDRDDAQALAREVLALIRGHEQASYYEAATAAEAHLLLRDVGAAARALADAGRLHGDDFAAVATTRRQLRLVCELQDLDPAVLDVLRCPAVAHFCGHRIAAEGAVGRFLARAEAQVSTAITAAVARHPVGYAYGALASGADILWAEALLAAGAELHVVLPFARDAFVASSVAPSGPGWVERFDRCLAVAASVRTATDNEQAHDALYRYGSELAMGLALVRARHLDTDAVQLALWDGGDALGAAGTTIDVATWRRGGRETVVVAPGPDVGPRAASDDPPDPDPDGPLVRAMLFADVKGFSKLTDAELPRFMTVVLGALASVLERFGDLVLYRNTWGDAVYAVFADPVDAAACALGWQEAMGSIDLAEARLPGHLALRLGGHVGPVFAAIDPVLGTLSFVGSHVSRTARIEPVTPVGAVYVTESFAAALELARPATAGTATSDATAFECDYVGHMPAAKDFGRLRMYRLQRPPVSDAD